MNAIAYFFVCLSTQSTWIILPRPTLLYWIWNQIAKGGAPPPGEKASDQTWPWKASPSTGQMLDFGHPLLPYHPPVLVHTFRVRVEIVLCIASKKLQQHSSNEKGAFPRPDTSRKINIEPENDAFGNTLFLFQGYILRFHINLPGCTI